MRSQLSEGIEPHRQHEERHRPVVERHRRLLPEPDMMDHAVAVPLDDIDQRIELDDPVVSGGDHPDRPEDRRHPESKLQQHRHQLPHIPEKDHHRRSDIGDPQYQHDHREEVVEELQPVEAEAIPVDQIERIHEEDKEDMHDQRREDFDHRQKGDFEDDLFDQIAVLHDGVGRVRYRIGEEKPRKHPRDQPEDERDILHRLGFEPYLKDEPEDKDRDHRLDKGPEYPQIGAQIALAKVVDHQRFENRTILYDICDKRSQIMNEFQTQTLL